MKKILFVDDDQAVLSSIENALRRERYCWDMVFARGGEATLVEIRKTMFDVVVSDMEMPVVSISRETPAAGLGSKTQPSR